METERKLLWFKIALRKSSFGVSNAPKDKNTSDGKIDKDLGRFPLRLIQRTSTTLAFRIISFSTRISVFIVPPFMTPFSKQVLTIVFLAPLGHPAPH